MQYCREGQASVMVLGKGPYAVHLGSPPAVCLECVSCSECAWKNHRQQCGVTAFRQLCWAGGDRLKGPCQCKALTMPEETVGLAFSVPLDGNTVIGSPSTLWRLGYLAGQGMLLKFLFLVPRSEDIEYLWGQAWIFLFCFWRSHLRI